jgi:hypothetical protein
MWWTLIPDWIITAGAAGLTGLVAFLFGAWRQDRKSRQREVNKRLEGYINTRKEIDEIDLGDDPAVLREWLRNRNPDKR